MLRRLLAAAVAAAAAGATALLGAPQPPRLDGPITGDAELAALTRQAADDLTGYRGLSIALVDNGRIRFAGLGDRGDGAPVERNTPFEVGSVTKALTGMLLARLAADGTVQPDDPLRSALPGVTGAAGDVTLAELASHRSGLPRLAITSPTRLATTVWAQATAGDPYAGQDRDWIVAAAGQTSPGDGRGEVNYSNLGMALLGQALAARAGTTYPDLLDRTLLEPLGMADTRVVGEEGELPAARASGARAGGRAADPWIGPGWAPAGIGVWSTAADLATLVSATLAGTAPGADAATARFDQDERHRIGYGWVTTRYGDQDVTWHNGGTGGFSAYVGLQRDSNRAVVVLGNTDRDVDSIGLRLLGVSPGQAADDDGPADWMGAGFALLATLAAGLTVLYSAWRGRDRLSLVAAAASATIYLVVARQLGDWSSLPAVIWPVGVALAAAGLAAGAVRWSALPLTAAGVRPWRRWTAAGVEVAAALLITLVLLA